MPKTLEETKERAAYLIELRETAGWLDLWDEVDDIIELNWTAPSNLELIDYVHEVVNTDPLDAVESASRIYTGEEPRVELDPFATNKPTMARVNELENYVKWQRDMLIRRNEEDLDREIMRSSVKYDFLIGQLEYLPWQLEVLEKLNKGEGKGDSGNRSKQRIEASLREGEFMLTMIDPRNAFPRFSKHGLQECMIRYVTDLQSFKDDFGANANSLLETVPDNRKDEVKCVTVWDYGNTDRRVVWAYAQEEAGIPEQNPKIAGARKVLNEKHKLPFVNFVAVRGGKSLQPMLRSIVDSGQWDTVCSLETAVMTEALAMSWAPRGVIKGPDGKNVEIIFGSPGRPMVIDDFHDYQPIPPPALDGNLLILADRERAKMEKSTLSSVLQGFTPESGVAFASINTASQSALKVLAPHRRLAERFWTIIFTQMLQWKHFTEDEVVVSSDKSIPGTDIPVDRLYFRTTLRADVPTDIQAKMNIAAQAIQIGYSKAKSMEFANENDPDGQLHAARQEAFEDVMTQSELAIEQARGALQAQAENAGLGLLAQMANDPAFIQQLQQLQQQMAQQLAGPQQAAAPPGVGDQARAGQPPGAGVGGDGFDPNLGGQNTAEAAPGQTRELQRGEDNEGTPI